MAPRAGRPFESGARLADEPGPWKTEDGGPRRVRAHVQVRRGKHPSTQVHDPRNHEESTRGGAGHRGRAGAAGVRRVRQDGVPMHLVGPGAGRAAGAHGLQPGVPRPHLRVSRGTGRHGAAVAGGGPERPGGPRRHAAAHLLHDRAPPASRPSRGPAPEDRLGARGHRGPAAPRHRTPPRALHQRHAARVALRASAGLGRGRGPGRLSPGPPTRTSSITS